MTIKYSFAFSRGFQEALDGAGEDSLAGSFYTFLCLMANMLITDKGDLRAG